MLREGRKYGVSILLASQLFRDFQDFVVGNTALKVALRVDDLRDQNKIAELFGIERNLIPKEKHKALVHWKGKVFSISTIPYFMYKSKCGEKKQVTRDSLGKGLEEKPITFTPKQQNLPMQSTDLINTISTSVENVVELYEDLLLTEEAFRKYLEKVRKVNRLSRRILEYYARLEALNGKKVNEVEKEFMYMILGGLNNNGTYREHSYASFVKEFLGFSISDPRKYAGEIAIYEQSDVTVITVKTHFIKFVELIEKLTTLIINKVSEYGFAISSKDEVDEDRKKVEELIESFVNTTLSLSIGIDSFATNVYNIRKIEEESLKKLLRKGIIQQKVLDMLGFKNLLKTNAVSLWGFDDYFTRIIFKIIFKEFIGEVSYIYINGVPTLNMLNDETKQQDFDFPKPKSIGGAICSLSDVIWTYTNYLNDHFVKWFNDYFNPFKKYFEATLSRMRNWDVPLYLKNKVLCDERYPTSCVKEDLYGYLDENTKELAYKPVNILVGKDTIDIIYNTIRCGLTSSRRYTYFYCGKYTFSEKEGYILLPKLLKDIMPALKLGLADITLSFEHYYKGYEGKEESSGGKGIHIMLRSRDLLEALRKSSKVSNKAKEDTPELPKINFKEVNLIELDKNFYI